MVLSGIDVRLGLLWGAFGFSWETLAKRLRATPFADVEPTLARLATKDGTQALRRVCRDATRADREAAVRWLVALGPRTSPMAPQADMAKVATPTLVDRMRHSFPAMPRREMAELIRRGPDVLPALLAILRRAETRPRTRGLLWAVVVVGKTRAVDAVAALAPLLRHPSSEIASAAAEALGHIGSPAFDVLRRAVSRGRGNAAVYACGGLAMVHTDEAYEFLVETLARSTAHADVVAGALARHRRPEALTVLRALSRRVPAWMSGAVTGAIAMLRDDRPSDALTSDWRLRYRRLPSLGWGLPPSWIQVAALARDQRRAANGQVASAMLAARRYSERSNRRCRRCDGDVWEPVGLPVCAHTASAVLQLQAGIVCQWCDDGRYDVWTALDACDGADLARAASPVATSDVSSMIGMVAIARATLYWMVSVGLEDLRAGGRHVRCVVRDIQVLYESHQPRVTPKRSAAPFRYTRTPAAPLPQSLS